MLAIENYSFFSVIEKTLGSNLNILPEIPIFSVTFLLIETLLFSFEQKLILFLETYFFDIPKNLITSAFFFPKQILKTYIYLSAKALKAALVKLTD